MNQLGAIEVLHRFLLIIEHRENSFSNPINILSTQCIYLHRLINSMSFIQQLLLFYFFR